MAKPKSPKPTGLSISRNGDTFTFAWKAGGKDYSEGQKLQYSLNGGSSWSNLSVTAGQRSKAITLARSSFYPYAGKGGISSVYMRVQGNQKAKIKKKNPTMSDWSVAGYGISIPGVPSLSATLDEALTNRCTFSWSLDVSTTNSYWFTDIEWQTFIIKNSNVNDGSKLAWNSGQVAWEAGTYAGSYSKTITEDTSRLATGSWTRWFRVRARGPRGASAWRYANHVYALPNKASITSASVEETAAGGFLCRVFWKTSSPISNPIDQIRLQYAIVTPGPNLACPSGTSWTDANVSGYATGNDGAVFSIDDQLSTDQCLFIRVNTTHDSNITYGSPYFAAAGVLSSPSNVSVSANNTTHKATITATNNSAVQDAFLVVLYRGSSDPTGSFPVGIIEPNETSVMVQAPDWSSETSVAFGVYAVVGSYTEIERADGADCYAVTEKMRSLGEVWKGGEIPTAPANVSLSPTSIPGTIQVTWDWTWEAADSAELSWSDHEDAWESTDVPSTYEISHLHAAKWNISGLETGQKWYVRIRLINGTGDNATYGPWSAIQSIDLSSAPSIPNLMLSDSVITKEGSVTASWAYSTTDGTAQAYAEICEATITPTGIVYGSYKPSEDIQPDTSKTYYEYSNNTYSVVATLFESTEDTEVVEGKIYYSRSGSGTTEDPYVYTRVEEPESDPQSAGYYEGINPSASEWYEFQDIIAHTKAEQHITINAEDVGWETGNTYSLCVRVVSASGKVSDSWSDPVSVIIAEPLECEITQTSLVSETITQDGVSRNVLSLKELPMTITATGAGVGGITTIAVERSEDYHITRPDETEFDGYEKETILLRSQSGEAQMEFDVEDLIGRFDDGARYRIVATIKDGLGQSAEDSIEFEVHWTHQALVPSVNIVVDETDLITKITPVAPQGAVASDKCDIYRLSVDKPELIVRDAVFGTTYVDPYPTLGEYGGHRIVFKTKNGDYITEDDRLAWVDTTEAGEDGTAIGTIDNLDYDIINFDNQEVRLYYNTDFSSSWEKDFIETQYLGGSIQGDWNPAISRSSSIDTLVILPLDQDMIRSLRDLAEYPGICRVRTTDGSNYAADVQVSEDRSHTDLQMKASYSFKITRVDPQGLDGMTLAEWEEQNYEEEES